MLLVKGISENDPGIDIGYPKSVEANVRSLGFSA